MQLYSLERKIPRLRLLYVLNLILLSLNAPIRPVVWKLKFMSLTNTRFSLCFLFFITTGTVSLCYLIRVIHVLKFVKEGYFLCITHHNNAIMYSNCYKIELIFICFKNSFLCIIDCYTYCISIFLFSSQIDVCTFKHATTLPIPILSNIFFAKYLIFLLSVVTNYRDFPKITYTLYFLIFIFIFNNG